MYVLVIWAIANGQVVQADSALYKTKEKCEEVRAEVMSSVSPPPGVKVGSICIDVFAKRI